MTTISAVVAAIVTALSANLGTYNLSGSDQVKEGTYDKPPGSVAFAAVLPAEMTGAVGQMRNTAYLEDWTIKIRLWAPYTADTTGNRVQAARTLASEAKKALDAARDSSTGTALTRCVRFATTGESPAPVNASAPSTWAHVELTLTLTLRRATQT